jgi:hypothetical protein
MGVERRPFEIIAECAMDGFPTTADIDRISGAVEGARRSLPDVVRAAVSPPAVFRDGRYVLESRFIVWADSGASATQTVRGLLETAGVATRSILPSGRALSASDVPAPSRRAKSAAAGRRTTLRAAPRRAPAKPKKPEAKAPARRIAARKAAGKGSTAAKTSRPRAAGAKIKRRATAKGRRR